MRDGDHRVHGDGRGELRARSSGASMAGAIGSRREPRASAPAAIRPSAPEHALGHGSGGSASSVDGAADRRAAARRGAARVAAPAPVGGRLGRAWSRPRAEHRVACTRRRSCSTQREQLRRWTSRRRAPVALELAPSSRSETRPLRPLAPAAAGQRATTRRRSALRAAAEQRAELVRVDPVRPRPARTAAGRRSPRARRPGPRLRPARAARPRPRRSPPPVHGTGGARGYRSKRRVLHRARHNSPPGDRRASIRLIPDQVSGEFGGDAVADYAKDVLVDTQWVEDHLEDDSIRIVEVDENPALYAEAHIPGRDRLRLEEGSPGSGQARLPRPGGVRRAVRQPRDLERPHDRPLRRPQQLVRRLHVLVPQVLRARQRAS